MSAPVSRPITQSPKQWRFSDGGRPATHRLGWCALRRRLGFAHPQCRQFFGKRIAALGRPGRRFNSRLHGLGPFVGHGLNQGGFVFGIGLRPLERGDEVGMGGGCIHMGLVVWSAIFCAWPRSTIWLQGWASG